MDYLLNLTSLVSMNDGRKLRKHATTELTSSIKCNRCNYTSVECPWRSWRHDIEKNNVPSSTPYVWIVNEEEVLCRFCFDQCSLQSTKTYRPYWVPSPQTAIDDVVMRDLLAERGFMLD